MTNGLFVREEFLVEILLFDQSLPLFAELIDVRVQATFHRESHSIRRFREEFSPIFVDPSFDALFPRRSFLCRCNAMLIVSRLNRHEKMTLAHLWKFAARLHLFESKNNKREGGEGGSCLLCTNISTISRSNACLLFEREIISTSKYSLLLTTSSRFKVCLLNRSFGSKEDLFRLDANLSNQMIEVRVRRLKMNAINGIEQHCSVECVRQTCEKLQTMECIQLTEMFFVDRQNGQSGAKDQGFAITKDQIPHSRHDIQR